MERDHLHVQSAWHCWPPSRSGTHRIVPGYTDPAGAESLYGGTGGQGSASKPREDEFGTRTRGRDGSRSGPTRGEISKRCASTSPPESRKSCPTIAECQRPHPCRNSTL